MMTLPIHASYRPKTVTSIGTLRLLGGILTVGLGLILAMSTERYLEFMGETIADYESMEELAFISGFVGGFFVLLGAIGTTIALAMLRGKKGAWMANVIFSSILILLSIGDILAGAPRSAVGIFINGFILYYMFTLPVRAYFGRVSLPSAPPTSGTAIA